MTTLTKRFTIEELDELDNLSPKDEIALLMMDVPELCWDACLFYLDHRPDRWFEIAQHYYHQHEGEV